MTESPLLLPELPSLIGLFGSGPELPDATPFDVIIAISVAAAG